MSERTDTFTVDDQPHIVVKLAAGSLRVVEGDEGEVEVSVQGGRPKELRVEQQGNTIMVVAERSGLMGALTSSFDVLIATAAGAHLEAKLGSANLIAEVSLASLRAAVASGNVRAKLVSGTVQLKTASGDVEIAEVSGDLRVASASGSVHVGYVEGVIEVTTASGDADIGKARRGVGAKTAAGDLRIRSFEGDSLRAKTLSGDVRVGVPPGRELDVELQTLSGDVRHDFEEDVTSESTMRASVSITTLSGDILLESSGY